MSCVSRGRVNTSSRPPRYSVREPQQKQLHIAARMNGQWRPRIMNILQHRAPSLPSVFRRAASTHGTRTTTRLREFVDNLTGKQFQPKGRGRGRTIWRSWRVHTFIITRLPQPRVCYTSNTTKPATRLSFSLTAAEETTGRRDNSFPQRIVVSLIQSDTTLGDDESMVHEISAKSRYHLLGWI